VAKSAPTEPPKVTSLPTEATAPAAAEAQVHAADVDAGVAPVVVAQADSAPGLAPDAATPPLAGAAAAVEEPAPKAPAKPHDFNFYMYQADRARGRERFDDALEAYSQASKLKPARAEPIAGRGLTQLDQGQKQAAVTSFQEALKLNPRYGVALMGLAEAYRALDMKEDAVKLYEKYLEVSPEGSEASVAKAAIERLKQ
jgi:tetratricopeptide (TPR) repeat protein